MTETCNIDREEIRFRLIMGLLALSVAIILGLPLRIDWLAIPLFYIGAFSVIEAREKYCSAVGFWAILRKPALLKTQWRLIAGQAFKSLIVTILFALALQLV